MNRQLFLKCVFAVLLFSCGGSTTSYAQSYIWARNNGSSMPMVLNFPLVLRGASGNADVSVTTTGTGIVSAAGTSAPGTPVAGGSNSMVNTFTGSGAIVSAGSAIFPYYGQQGVNVNGSNVVYDPQNANIRYIALPQRVFQVSTGALLTSLTGSNYTGWTFDLPFVPSSYGGSSAYVSVAKQTLSGTTWTTNWVRFIAARNQTNSTVISGTTSSLAPIKAAVIGGNTKVVVSYSVSGTLATNDIGVYSNGATVSSGSGSATNNTSHLTLVTSGASVTGKPWIAVQFDGSAGTPEGLYEVMPGTKAYTTPMEVAFADTSLLLLPYAEADTTAAQSFTYRYYNDASSSPAVTSSLGGWSGSTGTRARYALLRISPVSGALTGSYTDNLAHTAAAHCCFQPVSLLADRNNAYVVGHSLGSAVSTSYDADGALPTLSPMSLSATDLIAVKIPVSGTGATFAPGAAARYGGSGNESVTRQQFNFVGFVTGTIANTGTTALDTASGSLYILHSTSTAAGYSVGTATIQGNTDGAVGILQVRTGDLTARQGINLIGTSAASTYKTVARNNISSLAVDPVTGKIYIVGSFYNSAKLNVNTTTIKSLAIYNRVPPAVTNAGDVFFCVIDSSLSSCAPVDSDLTNIYGRSTNFVRNLGVNADGNPVAVSQFQGDFSWDGTALGGTAGTYSAGVTTDLLTVSDKATGTIIRAAAYVNADALNWRTFGQVAKISPYDGYLYVLGAGVNWKFYGSGAPTFFIANDDVSEQAVILSKVDPVTLQHQWSQIIAGATNPGNNADRVTAGLSNTASAAMDIDFNPANGDIFITGMVPGEDLYVASSPITSNVTYATHNLTQGSMKGYTFACALPAWAYAGTASTATYDKKSNFLVKLSSSGYLQYAAGFGYNNTSSGTPTRSRVAYLNGKVYVAYTPSVAGNLEVYGNGATRSSNTSSTTPVATLSANKTILMQFDANTAPTTATVPAMRSFGSYNGYISDITSNNNTGELFVGGSFTGTGSYGGSSVTSAGSTDVVIWALDPTSASLSDKSSGNLRVGGSGAEVLNRLRLDGSGRVYYAASTASTASGFAAGSGGNSTLMPASTGGNDFLVGSCEPSTGYSPVFCFVNGSVNSEAANDIAAGDVGTVFVAGDLKGTSSFGASGTIIGNTSGDLLLGRIDYPYQGPGGVTSQLNHWFDASYGDTVSSGNITALTNKNSLTIPNPLMPSLSASGTVVYNTPAVASPVINWYSSFVTDAAGTSLLRYSGLNAAGFTRNGLATTIFLVSKPTAAGSEVMSWKQSASPNDQVVIKGDGFLRSVSGSTGTASLSPSPSSGTWRIASLVYDGTSGSLNMYHNGSGTAGAVSTGALDMSSGGDFVLGGSGGAEIAELASYSYAFPVSGTEHRRILSSLALKYGVTLGNSFAYLNSKGAAIYDHRTGQPESAFPNLVFGLIRDDAAVLNQRQGTHSDNTLLQIGAANTITALQSSHPATLNEGDYAIVGASTTANNIDSNLVGNVPPGMAICKGYNVGKTWRVKVSTPLSSRSAALKQLLVRVNMAQTGITAARSASPSAPGSYFLIVDRNNNGSYNDTVDQLYQASTLLTNAGKDSIVEFTNVNFDTDGSGSDQFAIVWRTDGTVASAYTVNGNTGNMINYCSNSSVKYYRDPVTPTLSYVVLDDNGNSTFSPTHVSVQKQSAPTDVTVGGVSARLMNYLVRVSASGTYTTNGGVKVRIYYDTAMYAATKGKYAGDNTWIKYSGGSGTENDVLTAFSTDPLLSTAARISPTSSGTTTTGLGWVEFKVTSFSSFGFLSSNAVLPIELNQFHIEASGCEVSATWKSANEQGVRSYVLQYSADGKSYTDMGAVPAKGSVAEYSLSFPISAQGDILCRLKILHNDGHSIYTPLQRITGNCPNEQFISVAPNPVNSGDDFKVIVRGFADRMAGVLYNSVGVKEREFLLSDDVTLVSTAGLRGGVYFLRVYDPSSGHEQNFKVIINDY